MLIRKLRVRFQIRKKKSKQNDGRKAQREPVITNHVGNLDTVPFERVIKEPLFKKKRVPSVDELGNLLRSNLSTSLAAVKAPTAKHEVSKTPSTSDSTVIAQLQESDDDPPVSLLELAPMYQPVDNHLEATDSHAIVDDESNGDHGPSASLLETTAIYRPVGDHLERVDPSVIADEHVDKDNEPSASLLTTTEVFAPVNDHLEPSVQITAPPVSAAQSCTIEDGDSPLASLLIESRESSIKRAPQSATVPLQPSRRHPALLQKVFGLFTNRRRYSVVSEDRSGSGPNHVKVQSHSSTTATNPPSAPPTGRTVSKPNLPPRKPIPPKNLSLSPPVLATHRPYRPLEENLSEPFIPPAREHRYAGDYSVAPDIFSPGETQLGFAPTGPALPTLANRRQNSDTTLLDRNTTTWGKWYAKKSWSKNLPFAKVKSNGQSNKSGEGLTEQQVWDAHRTGLIRAHAASDKHTSNAEQGRASRLWNHLDHCFGAVTGDVYPFQSGRII